MAAAGLFGVPAVAGDWSTEVEPENPVFKYDAYAGAEATSHSRSFYGGIAAHRSISPPINAKS